MGWADKYRRRFRKTEPHLVGYYKHPDGSIDKTPRVLLVFPIFTHMFPQAFGAFSAMLLQAARYCPVYKFDVMVQERVLLHSAMNAAAEATLFNPFYVGMIAFDDDCLPPANTVARLLAHYEHHHDIVSAYGFMRSFPHTTTIGKLLPDGPTIIYSLESGEGEQRGFDWIDDLATLIPDEHGLATVDFCGMPAMFISRRVLEQVKPPYFAHSDGTGASMTHDIYFCNKARDAGFPIEVDLTLECGHIGPSPLITSETRKAARLAIELTESPPSKVEPEHVKAGDLAV